MKGAGTTGPGAEELAEGGQWLFWGQPSRVHWACPSSPEIRVRGNGCVGSPNLLTKPNFLTVSILGHQRESLRQIERRS